ncbi:MAG: VanZ family protein [Clostridia bacterium]|nr:VanZ family protein [Clostridia bacterium]
MKNRKLLLILSWSFVIICLAVIFYFSSQDAVVSKGTSDGLLDRIIDIFHISMTSKTIRRIAHAIEFFGLCLAFNMAFGILYEKFNPMLSFFSTAFYASSDEIHQVFVDGRACRWNDLCVDLSGALVITLILMVIYYFTKKHLAERGKLWQF